MKLLMFIAFAPIVIIPIVIICLIAYSSSKTVVIDTPKRSYEEGPGDPHLMTVMDRDLDTQVPMGSMIPEPIDFRIECSQANPVPIPEQKTIIVKQGLSINDIMKFEILDHIWR